MVMRARREPWHEGMAYHIMVVLYSSLQVLTGIQSPVRCTLAYALFLPNWMTPRLNSSMAKSSPTTSGVRDIGGGSYGCL